LVPPPKNPVGFGSDFDGRRLEVTFRGSDRSRRGARADRLPRPGRRLARRWRRPSKSEPKPTGFFGGGTKLRFPGD
ncbi:MAG: hypothetical protein AAFR01_04205, partial [Pseudomonadota bacterium]